MTKLKGHNNWYRLNTYSKARGVEAMIEKEDRLAADHSLFAIEPYRSFNDL